MKKVLLLIIAICAISVSLSAQEKYYIIPFNKAFDYKQRLSWYYIDKEMDVKHLVGIPKDSIYAIYSATINRSLPAPKDSIEYTYYKGNKFHIYTSVDKGKKEKYIIVDTNNNYDFSDDKKYVIPLNADLKSRDLICINVAATHYTQNNSYPTVLSIRVEPSDNLSTSFREDQLDDDSLLDISVWNSYCLLGSGRINGVDVNISAQSHSLLPSDLNGNFTFEIDVLNEPISASSVKTLKIGDSLEIANRIIKLNKVRKNFLFIEDLGAASIYGGTIGKQFPEELLVKEIKSMKEFNLHKSIEGKYVFIDFWGSWCGPCIQSMPKLVEMHKKIGKRKDVAVIGLAGEDERDLQKLSGLIKEKEVKWANYWYVRKEYSKADNPCQKMDITSYPTYIILDKSGKVVYRENSSSKAEEACNFFLDLIGKNK